jgi:DNA-binding winged helix-turn-helix (wHTH) protein
MRYFGGFSFDETHGLLWHEGIRVPLTAKAAGVLACLIEAGDRPLSKEEILRTVWHDTHVTPDNVKVLVREIRHALGDDARAARYVRTLSQGSYAFIAPVQMTPPVPGGSAERVFVGRTQELATLSSLLPTQDDRRTLGVVTGPPGCGKTALLEQAARAATGRGCLVVRAQCMPSSFDAEPYGCLLDTLSRLMTTVPSARALIEPYAPALIKHLHGESTPPESGRRETPPRLFRELITAFELLAVEAPLVLVLDDAHWLDAPDVDVIGALIRRHEALRLTVLLTARPLAAFRDSATLRQLIAEFEIMRLCRVVQLGPLGPLEIERYAETRFGAPAGAPIGELLRKVSEGSPVLIECAADTLVERHLVQRQGLRWTLRAGMGDLERAAVDAIRFVMQRRLDQLSCEERLLLAGVSHLGIEFSTTRACEALAREPAEIGPQLARLAERGEILVHVDSAGGDTSRMTFRFVNAMVLSLLNPAHGIHVYASRTRHE